MYAAGPAHPASSSVNLTIPIRHLKGGHQSYLAELHHHCRIENPGIRDGRSTRICKSRCDRFDQQRFAILASLKGARPILMDRAGSNPM